MSLRTVVVGCVLVLVAAALPRVSHAQLSDPTAPAIAYAVVLASSLNVRAAPSLSADIEGRAPRRSTLCVVRIVDDWAEVRTPTDVRPRVRGFVSRGFVSERRVANPELQELGCGSP